MRKNKGTSLVSLLVSLGVGATLTVAALSIVAKATAAVTRQEQNARAREVFKELRSDLISDLRSHTTFENWQDPRGRAAISRVFGRVSKRPYHCTHLIHSCNSSESCRAVGSLPGVCSPVFTVYQRRPRAHQMGKVLYETQCVDGVVGKFMRSEDLSLVHPELSCRNGRSRVVRKHWPDLYNPGKFKQKVYETAPGMSGAFCFRPCKGGIIEVGLAVPQGFGEVKVESLFFNLSEAVGFHGMEILPKDVVN